jgi:hypothetical protein
MFTLSASSLVLFAHTHTHTHTQHTHTQHTHTHTHTHMHILSLSHTHTHYPRFYRALNLLSVAYSLEFVHCSLFVVFSSQICLHVVCSMFLAAIFHFFHVHIAIKGGFSFA